MTRAREVQMGGAIALAAAAILLLPGLGTLDLWAPDEPRYAEIADEIVRSDRASSWILLELGGEPVQDRLGHLRYRRIELNLRVLFRTGDSDTA